MTKQKELSTLLDLMENLNDTDARRSVEAVYHALEHLDNQPLSELVGSLAIVRDRLMALPTINNEIGEALRLRLIADTGAMHTLTLTLLGKRLQSHPDQPTSLDHIQ